MSFIRRSDGTVVYNGQHVESRGSLSSLKNNEEDCEEDTQWEQQVIATFMSAEDSLYSLASDYEDMESEIISRIWGIYNNDCPHVIRKSFNEKIFTPAY